MTMIVDDRPIDPHAHPPAVQAPPRPLPRCYSVPTTQWAGHASPLPSDADAQPLGTIASREPTPPHHTPPHQHVTLSPSASTAPSRSATPRKSRGTTLLDFGILSENAAMYGILLMLALTNVSLLKLLPWRDRKFDDYPTKRLAQVEQMPLFIENVLQISLQVLYMSVTPMSEWAVPVFSLTISLCAMLFRIMRAIVVVVAVVGMQEAMRRSRFSIGLRSIGSVRSIASVRFASSKLWAGSVKADGSRDASRKERPRRRLIESHAAGDSGATSRLGSCCGTLRETEREITRDTEREAETPGGSGALARQTTLLHGSL